MSLKIYALRFPQKFQILMKRQFPLLSVFSHMTLFSLADGVCPVVWETYVSIFFFRALWRPLAHVGFKVEMVESSRTSTTWTLMWCCTVKESTFWTNLQYFTHLHWRRYCVPKLFFCKFLTRLANNISPALDHISTSGLCFAGSW